LITLFPYTTLFRSAKPKADDKRLAAALETVGELIDYPPPAAAQASF
jgi:hypothetical protein